MLATSTPCGFVVTSRRVYRFIIPSLFCISHCTTMDDLHVLIVGAGRLSLITALVKAYSIELPCGTPSGSLQCSLYTVLYGQRD